MQPVELFPAVPPSVCRDATQVHQPAIHLWSWIRSFKRLRQGVYYFGLEMQRWKHDDEEEEEKEDYVWLRIMSMTVVHPEIPPKLLILSGNAAIQGGPEWRIWKSMKKYSSCLRQLVMINPNLPQDPPGSFRDTVPLTWSYISTKIYQVCYYRDLLIYSQTAIQSSCNPIADTKQRDMQNIAKTISSVCYDKMKDSLSFRQEKFRANWRLHSLQPNFNPRSEIQCPMMSDDVQRQSPKSSLAPPCHTCHARAPATPARLRVRHHTITLGIK